MGSQIEVVIDASIVTSQESHSHGYHINDIVSKPSRSSLLTTLHAGYYRISLSLGAQTLLWKMLSDSASDPQQAPLHVFHILPPTVFLLLWCLALLAPPPLTPLYILRCFFHFPMVKAEFLHHIGVNFVYAPWISWLLMLQSSPLISPENATYQVLWFVFSVPVMALDAKIYGQWLTKGKRLLSKMANPTSQFSVLGNVVGARAAAQMGWKESASFMFSLGMAHYFVLFVTTVSACIQWQSFSGYASASFLLVLWDNRHGEFSFESSISGAFDNPSKLLFFLSLFLFMSLACTPASSFQEVPEQVQNYWQIKELSQLFVYRLVRRPALFKKSLSRFDVAWWAYSFALTFLALASVEYAKEVKGRIALGLMLALFLPVLVFLA